MSSIGVKRASLLSSVLLLCSAISAQRNGGTTLVVQVRPEAHLDPSQVMLSFRVSADGTADVTTQTAAIAAWVRALAGQQIHLRAIVANLAGPDGPVAASQLSWSGSPAQATGGGQQAGCTSGSFSGGAARDLAANWQRSGTLTCAVTFSLASPRALTPGNYSGTVQLALVAE